MLKIEIGIQTPCWILCTPRSGSTYLSKILNNTNLFNPNFSEYLGWKRNDFLHPNDLKNAPKFCKTLHVHINRIFHEPNFLKDIHHDNKLQFIKPKKQFRLFVEKQIPGIKFLLLERKDIISQTISYCVTTEISKIHKKSFFNMTSINQQEEFENTNISISDELLLSYFKTCTNYTGIWDEFLEGTEFYKLYYEDINATEIKNILNYLGHNKKSNISCETSNSLIAVSKRKDVDEIKKRLQKIVL